MNDLLSLLINERAEGMSVRPGQAPVVHLRGEVHLIEGPSVSEEEADLLFRMLTDTRQMREFRERGSADFIFTFQESAQFRVEARTEHDDVHFQIHRIAA